MEGNASEKAEKPAPVMGRVVMHIPRRRCMSRAGRKMNF